MIPPLNRAGVHSTLKIYTSIASRQFWSVQITSKQQSSQIRNCTDSNTQVKDTDTNTQLQIYKYKYTSPVVRLDRSRTLQSATQCLVFNFCCQLDIVKPQTERVVSFEIMHFLFLPTHWVSQCNGAIGASISYRLCYSNLSFWLWRVLISAVTPPRVKRNLLARQNERSQKCFMHSSRHSFTLWVLFLPLGRTTFILNHECMNSSSSSRTKHNTKKHWQRFHNILPYRFNCFI